MADQIVARDVSDEVKLRRDSETEADALDQVAGYLDIAGLDDGYLVMFDLRGSRAGWTRSPSGM